MNFLMKMYLITTLFLFGYFIVVNGFGQDSGLNKRSPVLSYGFQQNVNIGGLFDDGGDPLEEIAFKHAIQRVNEKLINSDVKLTAKLDRILPGNSYYANDTTCRMLNEGVAVIIGPQNSETSCHVQSICDTFEILNVQTNWDFHICKNQYMVNLFPHPDTLGLAIADLVEDWQWVNYTILYDDGLQKFERLLRASVPPKRVLIRRLPVGTDFRPLLEDILHHEDFKCIIIDTDAEKAALVLKQAQQIGLMNRNYKYILTTLDIHTIDLENFMYGKIPIRAFRMVDPLKPDVQEVVKQFNSLAGLDNRIQEKLQFQTKINSITDNLSRRNGQFMKDSVHGIIASPKSMPVNIALLYDAVQLFGNVLPKLSKSNKINTRPLSCTNIATEEDGSISGYGSTIMSYMKTTNFEGLTGVISFGNNGFRSDLTLDIVQLQKQGLKKIGIWSNSLSSKFSWDRSSFEIIEPPKQTDDLPINEREFRIVTIINEPFCMNRRNTSALTGNDRFEGYNIDLIQKISEILDFKYKIHLVYDGTSYGTFNEKTKQWDGVIKEVLENTADIAVGDLAINEIRQTAVDFTMPHMNLGISILYVVPMAKPPGLLSFMNPFAPEVWVCTVLAFFGVVFTLFVVARLSPKEWDSPMPCIRNPTKLYNQFSLANSVWFTIGAIMQQGSDYAPKSTSTRIVGAMWWFFTLIMISSYTAGLALFLIVQEKDESLKGLKDLVRQEKVKFGCVQRGSTYNFFKGAQPGPILDAYEKMEKMVPSPYMEKNIYGIEKVKAEAGGYAFIMESTLIEYNVAKECGLAKLGELLDSKGYGIILPKNSTYLGAFNGAILKLQERGVLSDLKRTWWKDKVNPPVCEGQGLSSVSVQALGLANLSGIFVVLVVGCALGTLLTGAELIWRWKKTPPPTDVSKKEQLINELKFSLDFGTNVKATGNKKSSVSIGSGNLNADGSVLGEIPEGFGIIENPGKESDSYY